MTGEKNKQPKFGGLASLGARGYVEARSISQFLLEFLPPRMQACLIFLVTICFQEDAHQLD